MNYPVELEVDYPERLSRWMWLVKWLLAIPHFIIVAAFSYLVYAIVVVVVFALLFTGRYPNGLFNLVAGYLRWSSRAQLYPLMRDEYPPFSMGEESQYPVRVRVERPEHPSRWMWLVKWFLVIPHIVVLALYAIAAFFVIVVAVFAILFTGRFPRGMFDFVVGFYRWQLRVNAYAVYQMTDQYPPFSGKPSAQLS